MTGPLSILAGVAAAALSLAVSTANADIFIGLQQNDDPIQTVASGPGFVIFDDPFGEFESVAVAGFGQPSTVPPTLLQVGNVSINNEDGDAGTLTVYVTSTGNTDPLGLLEFISNLGTFELTPGWTATLETYVDPGNGVYALTTLLGSAFFTDVAFDLDTAIANAGGGPYSKTAVIRITAPTEGVARPSVSLAATAVPEPASLALLSAALAGLGIIARRRRRAA